LLLANDLPVGTYISKVDMLIIKWAIEPYCVETIPKLRFRYSKLILHLFLAVLNYSMFKAIFKIKFLDPISCRLLPLIFFNSVQCWGYLISSDHLLYVLLH
jgi:hypothetical protein